MGQRKTSTAGKGKGILFMLGFILVVLFATRESSTDPAPRSSSSTPSTTLTHESIATNPSIPVRTTADVQASSPAPSRAKVPPRRRSTTTQGMKRESPSPAPAAPVPVGRLILPPPATMFAGERFVMHLGDDALPMERYTWIVVSSSGEQIEGEGEELSFPVPESWVDQDVVIRGLRNGEDYAIHPDTSAFLLDRAEFRYVVKRPPIRITELSFRKDGEYRNGRWFRFVIFRAGTPIAEHRRPVPGSAVDIRATNLEGVDFLKDYTTRQEVDSLGRGMTVVRFQLKGPVRSSLETVIISLRVASKTFRIPVGLYNE